MTDYKEKVKQIIARRIGLEAYEIKEDMFFEDDLNLGHLELAEILEEIEETLQIELSEHKDDIDSIEDLFEIIQEQYD